MTKITIALAASLLALAACSNMNATEQRTLSGASIGAVTGAVGTAIFHGNPIWGAVGGAAVALPEDTCTTNTKKKKPPITMQGITPGKNLPASPPTAIAAINSSPSAIPLSL